MYFINAINHLELSKEEGWLINILNKKSSLSGREAFSRGERVDELFTH